MFTFFSYQKTYTHLDLMIFSTNHMIPNMTFDLFHKLIIEISVHNKNTTYNQHACACVICCGYHSPTVVAITRQVRCHFKDVR